MATYEYQQFLEHLPNDAFRSIHNPGSQAPYGGIYRCEACGHEIAIATHHHLPPQNHGQHPSGQPIHWRLIVAHA